MRVKHQLRVMVIELHTVGTAMPWPIDFDGTAVTTCHGAAVATS